ncbi:MAG: ABC transporter ATP-binding protein [Actinomycetota bacterium]|nr:ABC transporter ATP-binding protein [Actinomycetota bacterium]
MSRDESAVVGSSQVSVAAAGTASAALEVAGLTAGYSTVPIVEAVDITVRNGEVVLLVGPNGAGKSTVLKAIVGAIPRLDGQVRVLGRKVGGKGPAAMARAGVAYVPQNDDVFLQMSVQDNLLMGGFLLSRADRTQRMARWMDVFPALGAAKHKPASALSGGQRKTLALARALMVDPYVIVLDEPTAGLSPKIAREVLEQNVAPLRNMGKAVLMVEQRVGDALRIADQVEVLVSGRVVLAESAAAFRSRSDAARWLMGAMSEQVASAGLA